MTDWTSGYVADIGYTYGYYKELNPLRYELALLTQGIAFPECATVCELGYGQGLSANIHASASDIKMYGTDFNPAQAAFANELAHIADNQAQLYDQSFDEFLNNPALPEFDFIGIHGIWSWISQENQQILLEFIQRKLKVGGVLYISYNAMPGWSNFAPVKHLMRNHALVMEAEGSGIINRIDSAIDFVSQLFEVETNYGLSNNLIKDKLEELKKQDKHYLAHEYFNKDWDPKYFSEMKEALEQVKLEYACSAHYLDLIDNINLKPEHQELLSTIPDMTFKETVRDFITNQQFRRDYWIKGKRRLSIFERLEKIRSHRIILIVHPDDIKLDVKTNTLEVGLLEAIYLPIIHLLANYQVLSLAQIEQSLQTQQITLTQIIEAVLILKGKDYIESVQSDPQIKKNKQQCDQLNHCLILKSRDSAKFEYLASPVTGGGIRIERFKQLLILAMSNGQKTLEQMVQATWNIYCVQNQKILKKGKPLETEEENIQELKIQAKSFIDKELDILKALKIV